jgi:hypothetical protein
MVELAHEKVATLKENVDRVEKDFQGELAARSGLNAPPSESKPIKPPKDPDKGMKWQNRTNPKSKKVEWRQVPAQ